MKTHFLAPEGGRVIDKRLPNASLGDKLRPYHNVKMNVFTYDVTLLSEFVCPFPISSRHIMYLKYLHFFTVIIIIILDNYYFAFSRETNNNREKK